MLHKTRGIVFKLTDYSESSVVVQVLTEHFGLQSYLINGVKKAKAKVRLNMLQPLHLLEMVVYHKSNGGIQRVSEVRNLPVFQTIPYQIAKSSIVLFLNEVLCKSVKQNYDDEPLFDFLFNSIEWLDKSEVPVPNFHLSFLLQLTRYLGFYPNRNLEEEASYFNLIEGHFTTKLPDHALIIHGESLFYFRQLLQLKFNELQGLKMPGFERKQLLENILKYYSLHLENFSNIKSHLILEEVLD